MHLIMGVLILIMSLTTVASGATRLGLFHTAEEVAVWAQRAANGPYKSAGDVSTTTNSPGDWDRIVVNRNAFASNPSNGRWGGPTTFTGAGCVATNANLPPDYNSTGWSHRLRDAAFHNLVMGVTTDHAALKTELLWLVNTSWSNWEEALPWCFGVLWDFTPAFSIPPWLLRVLFAYDYLGRDAFSQAELDQIDRWFFDAADYWRRDMDFSQNDQFVNRWAGNYTVKVSACEPAAGDLQYGYTGGPEVCRIARRMNNRRGSILSFTFLVGVYLTEHGRNYTDGRYGTQADLVQSGKMYVEEYVRYAIFPEGMHGDFHRSALNTTAKGESGWSYSGHAFHQVLMMADALARTGDPSLYTYNSADGWQTTIGTINDGGSRVGQNKDLLFGLQSYMKYHTDIYVRYFPTIGVEDDRLDGRLPRSGSTWAGVHDTQMAQANLYFQDTFVTQAYTRTHPGSVGYPSSPQGGPPVWMGQNGVYPGTLFMFGQMEGVVDPYNLSSDTLAPKPPTGFTATMTSAMSITLDCTAPTQNTDDSALTDLAGYTANWCQNADCSLVNTFTFASCPHVHSGLNSGTLHRYQIAARDTSGNLSTFVGGPEEATTDTAPPPTLIGHWADGTQTTGTTISNVVSPGTHDGTASGDFSWDGAWMVFGGSNAKVEIPNHADLRPTSLSLCFFAMPTGTQVARADLVNKAYQNDAAQPWASYAVQLARPTFPVDSVTTWLSNTAGGQALTTAGGAMPNDTETHSCVVYEPAGTSPQWRIYLGGNLTTSTTATGALIYDTTTTGHLYFGHDGASRYYQGKLRDVRLYAGALNPTDIAELASGATGVSGAFAMGSWRWRHVDCAEDDTDCFQRPANRVGRIVRGNRVQVRLITERTVDTSALTELNYLYYRSPSGSGAYTLLDDTCSISKPFCYGFNRHPTITGTVSTTAQLASVGEFVSGLRLYRAFEDRIHQVSMPVGKAEAEHVIRAAPDTTVGTTVGFCGGTAAGPHANCDETTEALGQVVLPYASGG